MSRASAGIREGLSRACERFADTAEAVAHKVDAPSGVKDDLSAMKDTARDKAGQVARHLHEGADAIQDKAEEVTRRAARLKDRAWGRIPAPVTGRVTHLVRTVRQRPVPAAAMGFT
ncbi:MAG TPA: hypothetical protein VFO16_00035, partial [Pseudonocardiaceae bacterium]|nr:hypothetical protein [Pseudonocardiaceae bacterium]